VGKIKSVVDEYYKNKKRRITMTTERKCMKDLLDSNSKVSKAYHSNVCKEDIS
jgi:hypothetical protein